MAPDVEPQFVPPPNWTSVSAGSEPSIVGAWLSPIPAADGFRQNINVGRYPLDESVHAYVTDSLAQFKHVSPSLKILRRGKNDTCAEGASEIVDLVEMAKPLPDHPAFPLEVVEVFTGTSTGSIFVTSYSRLPSSPEDPEAMQAIKRMCQIS